MRHRIPRRRRLLEFLAIATLVAGCASCHDSRPTAPSSPPVLDLSASATPLRLSPQRFMLRVSGYDDSYLTTASPCRPPLVPRAGKVVTTFVWFAWEGENLVGRSRPPYRSTLEIRLRRVSSSPAGVVVDGTISGMADDEYDRFQGRLDTAFGVAPGESALLEGVVLPYSPGPNAEGDIVGGVLRGPMTFRDSSGAAAACTDVQYLLQVLPPGAPDDGEPVR